MCVCVCVWLGIICSFNERAGPEPEALHACAYWSHTHRHTHTHACAHVCVSLLGSSIISGEVFHLLGLSFSTCGMGLLGLEVEAWMPWPLDVSPCLWRDTVGSVPAGLPGCTEQAGRCLDKSACHRAASR